MFFFKMSNMSKSTKNSDRQAKQTDTHTHTYIHIHTHTHTHTDLFTSLTNKGMHVITVIILPLHEVRIRVVSQPQRHAVLVPEGKNNVSNNTIVFVW